MRTAVRAVILVGCAAASASAAPAGHDVLAKLEADGRLVTLVPAHAGRRGVPSFTLKTTPERDHDLRGRPGALELHVPQLIEDVVGNLHIDAVIATDDQLELRYGWEQVSPYNSVELAQISWPAIAADVVAYNQVRTHMITAPGTLTRFDRPAPPSAAQLLDAAKLAHGAVLGQRDRVIFDAHQLIGTDAGGAPVWQVAVPAGFTILDADVVRDWVIVTTTSFQGYHDGELYAPMRSTQVWGVRAPDRPRR